MRHTSRMPGFGRVITIALLVVLLGPVLALSRPGDVAASTGGRFYVVGPDIIAPDGSKFVPVGANVGVHIVTWNPPTYAFTSQGFTARGRVAEALAWGWNTIRVNVACNPGSRVTLQQTIDGVQRVIDEYTSHGIVVMPECHDLTGVNPALSDRRFADIHTFWDAILARNGTNPYVWVNYLNEPFTVGSADPRWSQLGVALYDRVRAKGTENLFVWDFPGWGQGAGDLGAAGNNAAPNFVSGRCNVVLSWHNYGAAGDAEQMSAFAQNLIDKKVAVVVGELGYDWAGHRFYAVSYAFEKRGADWTFANAARFGFGALYWHGTATDGTDEIHSFRQGGYGAWYSSQYPLSAGGQQMWNLGQNRPTFARPTVNLADSSCPSATSQPVTTTTTGATSTTIATTTTTVVTGAPGAFAKNTPNNGARNRPTSQTLSWASSAGAAGYEYCLDVAPNGTCNGAWVPVGTATSASVSGLPNRTVHEWQVRAVNAVGTTVANGGNWWQFTTR
jgi:mannan endo-1,4-beta-mannosidase